MHKLMSEYTKNSVIILLYLGVIIIWTHQTLAQDFICTNGEAVQFTTICNGVKDCSDGSDEVSSLCYHVLCPDDKLRCHYGACISNTSLCDGVKHCADGSDEIRCGERKDIVCGPDEYSCPTSEQCIPKLKLCDAISDCNDGSDEAPSICEKISCPLNSYRCKIGGCIRKERRCNGYADCVDGSDESDILCKNLNCLGDEKKCDQEKDKIRCPPIASTRILARCEIPFGNLKGTIPCNQSLPVGTKVTYECKPYYVPDLNHDNNNETICQDDGTWNREVLKCTPDCGKAEPDVSPLILHGWMAEQNKYPWHSSIYVLQSGNWTFSCGGSLITEQVVLTAAHCAWNIPKQDLQIALAKHYKDFHKEEDNAQIRNVSKIIFQPLYQDLIGNYGSDLAILILDRPVEFSPVVLPVCIDWNLDDITEHLSRDNLGLIVGMGLTENGTTSDSLRVTRLPVVSDKQCITSQRRDFRKYIQFTTFCAGWGNGTAVCNGDSGGGLVFPSKYDKNRWTLQGIVSVSPRKPGTFSCDPKYYTVFTKVGMYVQWIHKTLLDVHYDVMARRINVVF